MSHAQECLVVPLAPFAASSPDLGRMVALARTRHLSDALAVADALKVGPAQPGSVPPEAVDYLLARTLEEAGEQGSAAAIFRRLDRSVLSDDSLIRQASALLARSEITAARVALARISEASPDRVQARLMLARSLIVEGRPSLGLVVLKDLLRGSLTRAEVHQARMGLVAVLEATGDEDAARDSALTAYLTAPEQGQAREAMAALARLSVNLSPALATLRTLVNTDGHDLARLARWARGASRQLRAMDPALPNIIEAAAAQEARKDIGLVAGSLRKAVDAAVDPTVKAHAMLALGSALIQAGREDEARTVYGGILADFPRSPFAAPASIALGRLMMRVGDYEGAVKVLTRVGRDYPESGLSEQASWELALAGLISGRHESALLYLDGTLARLDRGKGVLFGLAEKARYFRGVVLHDLGRTGEGLEDLARVARGYPHSYYGVLAVSRLKAWGGPLPAEATRSGAMSPVGEETPAAAPQPRMVRVCGTTLGPVLLWRLGFAKDAIRELEARARLGFLDEGALHVLAAMQAIGRQGRAAMWAREHLRGLPTKEDADIFAAAYPRPFLPAVEEASTETRVDPGLIYGVMRAESNFNPSARSPRGAVGLMQLLPATARTVAARILGRPGLSGAMYGPRGNILLGSALLAELDRHFRGHVPLMLAGYNAGPGAARKFYRRFGQLPTDLFVEMVPYSVTAAYIKRVISLAAGYRSLYDDAGRGPLLLDTRLPVTLGPFLEPRQQRPSAELLNPGTFGDNMLALGLEGDRW